MKKQLAMLLLSDGDNNADRVNPTLIWYCDQLAAMLGRSPSDAELVGWISNWQFQNPSSPTIDVELHEIENEKRNIEYRKNQRAESAERYAAQREQIHEAEAGLPNEYADELKAGLAKAEEAIRAQLDIQLANAKDDLAKRRAAIEIDEQNDAKQAAADDAWLKERS